MIPFYFDFISPYAYLGWELAGRYSAQHGVHFEPRPILFAGLLNHWGQKGPAEIAPKRDFTFRDVVRRAAALGIPVALPHSHPFNPLLPLRLTLAAPQSRRAEVVSALFGAVWARGAPAADPTALALALEGGFPRSEIDGWLSRATSPEIKQTLKDESAAAVEAGVFGVPTLLAEGQILWGHDQFEILSRVLDGSDPARHLDDAELAALVSTAKRTLS